MNKKNLARAAAAAAISGLCALSVASPAQAFSASSTMTSGGLTYKAYAESCNLYWNSCSWYTNGSLSASRTFTHTSDVKANGIGVTINISTKEAGVSISGNSTSMAHAVERGYGTYSSTAGVASPSIFSVSVAARSKMATSVNYVQTGWTTW